MLLEPGDLGRLRRAGNQAIDEGRSQVGKADIQPFTHPHGFVPPPAVFKSRSAALKGIVSNDRQSCKHLAYGLSLHSFSDTALQLGGQSTQVGLQSYSSKSEAHCVKSACRARGSVAETSITDGRQNAASRFAARSPVFQGARGFTVSWLQLASRRSRRPSGFPSDVPPGRIN